MGLNEYLYSGVHVQCMGFVQSEASVLILIPFYVTFYKLLKSTCFLQISFHSSWVHTITIYLVPDPRLLKGLLAKGKECKMGVDGGVILESLMCLPLPC